LQKLEAHYKVIEAKDTASVAKRIKEQGLKNVAAIAGKRVSEKFGLTLLERKI
jgi:prephenate dehydratase